MGLVFFRTAALDTVVRFYTESFDASVWLEQPDCTILERGSFRLGFCRGDAPETCGTITFVYDDRSGVDAAHERLRGRADGEPRYNDSYEIYQFFATDPEGRTVECQTFEHEG
jgi:hypothetical protein